jgi:hypothetical protein
MGLASPLPVAKPLEPPPHQKEESPRRIFPFEREVFLGLASPLPSSSPALVTVRGFIPTVLF